VKSAGVGNRCVVIKWAYDVRHLAAFAIKKLADCAGGFPAWSPLDWNFDDEIPAL
jgi:hypothetical protein